MLWRLRKDRAALVPWAAPALLSLIATALLFWQTRATPAAQLLAIPGATALAWLVVVWSWSIRNPAMRFAVMLGAFLLSSGTDLKSAVRAFPEPVNTRLKSVRLAHCKFPHHAQQTEERRGGE